MIIKLKVKSEKLKAQCGFTLIEILIVMVIIGLMAVISLFALRGARESGRDAKRKGDLEAIRSALELYKADCNRYPASLPWGSPLNGDGTNCPNTNRYIEVVPNDTMTGRNYSYTPSGSPPRSFTLCSSLETGTGSVSGCGSCGATCNYKVRNP